jgi:phage shock protein A
MGLLNRIATLAKAKASKAVDAAEEGNLSDILGQNIRDSKVALKEIEKAVNEIGGQRKTLEQKEESLKADIKRWGKSAETAVMNGKDDLAAQSLDRQTEFEQQLEANKASLKAMASRHEALTAKLLEKREFVRKCESRLSTAKAQEAAAEATMKASQTLSKCEGDGNAMNQIELYEQKIQDKMNQAEAAEELNDSSSGESLEREIAQMEAQSSSADKLAALKAKMGK